MEANDASSGSGDATTRAQELRASLGARQDAETMVAEASRIRQEAVAAADALVDEAQQLSTQLVAESRAAAEQETADARERSDAMLARARTEAQELADRARATADAIRAKAEADVEEHRRRVRAEVTEQVTRELTETHRVEVAAAREQSDALISDLEASIRILGVSLESANANVSELLGTLGNLRSSTDGSPVPTHVARVSDLLDVERPAEPTTERVEAAEPAEPAVDVHADDGDEPPAPPPASLPAVEEESYDHGNPAPATTVPSPVSQFRAEPEEPEGATDVAAVDEAEPSGGRRASSPVDALFEDTSGNRPRTATEAFLTSSSLEVEQATRELRDLQNPEDARRRRSEESRRAAQRRELEEGLVDEDPDPADPADPARPLGWLFRTAQ